MSTSTPPPELVPPAPVALDQVTPVKLRAHGARRIVELWRFGQVGLVNTAFGAGAYFLLVWLGLGIFVAQLLANVLAPVFNYVTYSHHVFRGAAASKLRFAASYGLNYLISVLALAGTSRLIASPYTAGLVAIAMTAAINFVVLKHLVFVRTKPE